MHKELSDLFDQGIEFVTTMLIDNHILEAEFSNNVIYDDYLHWLHKTYENAEENFSEHPATKLLRASVNRIDIGSVNIIVEHQVVLKLISQLIRFDYQLH